MLGVIVGVAFACYCYGQADGDGHANTQTKEVVASKELVRQSIAERAKIAKGSLVAEVRYSKDVAHKEMQDVIRVYRIDFDGSKIRSIVTWKGPTWERTTRVLVRDGKAYVDFSDKDPVEIWELDQIDSPATRQDGWDPRVLGMVCSQVSGFHEYSLEKLPKEFWFSVDKDNTPAEPEGEGDSLTYHIKHYPMADITVDMTIRPELNFSVTSLNIQKKSNESVINMLSTTNYRRNGSAVFPNETSFEISKDGDTFFHQIIKVLEIDLNPKFGDDVFSIKGLGLPPGRSVIEKSHNRLFHWDGEKLVQETMESLAARGSKNGEEASSKQRKFFFLAASNCLLLSAIAIWAYAYRKQKKNV